MAQERLETQLALEAERVVQLEEEREAMQGVRAACATSTVQRGEGKRRATSVTALGLGRWG